MLSESNCANLKFKRPLPNLEFKTLNFRLFPAQQPNLVTK